jgi:hypothetical protein
MQKFKYVKAAEVNNKEKKQIKGWKNIKKEKERLGVLIENTNKELRTKEKFIGLVQIAFPNIRVIYNGL